MTKKSASLVRHELFHKLLTSDQMVFQFIRYLFVGGTAFIVDYGLLTILVEFVHIHYLIAATIGFTAGLIVNYVLATKYVFSKRKLDNKLIEMLIFAIIGIIGLGINDLVLYVSVEQFNLHYMMGKIFSVVIVLFWNYLARLFTLFR